MGRVKSIGVATAVVVGPVALALPLPEDVAIALLGGACGLGLATAMVCVVLDRAARRSHAPAEHGTVEVDGMPGPAVIFPLARRHLLLAVILMAATVPMAVFIGGVLLFAGIAELDTTETGWGGFLGTRVAPALPFLGAGIYLTERTMAALRAVQRRPHIACGSTVLRIELPTCQVDIRWNDIVQVRLNERVLAVDVVDESQVWTRLGRRTERNLRDYGSPVVVDIQTIDSDLLGQELSQRLGLELRPDSEFR